MPKTPVKRDFGKDVFLIKDVENILKLCNVIYSGVGTPWIVLVLQTLTLFETKK